MGTFEAFYASALQHPLLLWAAALAAALWCWRLGSLDPSARSYCRALVVLSLADAWLTSSHVYGVGTLPDALQGPVPLFFVLAGDFRFLLLFGAARAGGRVAIGTRSVASALGLTLVVPILSQAVLLALGTDESRILFFVYEISFVALTLGLLRWHPAARDVAWLVPVGRFVLVYYALWASADAVILLTGSDLGFALRVVPNVLYYGGLIAVIGSAANRAAER